MSKNYDSTEPRRGDSNLILLEKLVQKLGGTYKHGETINSLLSKILTLTAATAEAEGTDPAAPVVPRRFVAQITQLNQDAPTQVVLANTLGETPVWSYLGVGVYQLQLTTGNFALDINKVTVLVQDSVGRVLIGWFVNVPDTIVFRVYRDGSESDSELFNTTLVIEIYP